MDLMNKEFIILCLLSFFIGYIFKNILKNNHSCGLRENFVADSFKDYPNNIKGINHCVEDGYNRHNCEDHFIYNEFKEKKKDINKLCNEGLPNLKKYCGELGFVDDSVMFCPWMIECKNSNFDSSGELHKLAIKKFIDKDIKFNRVYSEKKLEGFSSPKQYENNFSGYKECHDFVEGSDDLKKKKCSQGLVNSLLYNEPNYTINNGTKNPRLNACYRIMKKEQVDMPESEKCDSFSAGEKIIINDDFYKNSRCRGAMKCVFDTRGDLFAGSVEEITEKNKQILCEIIKNDESIKKEPDMEELLSKDYLGGELCDKILNSTKTDMKTEIETDMKTDMETDIETDIETDMGTDMEIDTETSDDKIEPSHEMIEKKQYGFLDGFFNIFR